MSEKRSIAFDQLLDKIQACQTCAAFLPNAPKPILGVSLNSKILIIGQAPGNKVHQSGIPFFDKSGINLRQWLGVTEAEFYDTKNFDIIPLGFCFPGTRSKGGDLPPRKECAPQWHLQLLEQLENVELILLVGQYAQKYYLGKSMKKNLTETVKYGYEYAPKYFPIVHPSPLNFRWHGKNSWFVTDVVPHLQAKIKEILSA